jgi:hypothetical protein
MKASSGSGQAHEAGLVTDEERIALECASACARRGAAEACSFSLTFDAGVGPSRARTALDISRMFGATCKSRARPGELRRCFTDVPRRSGSGAPPCLGG